VPSPNVLVIVPTTQEQNGVSTPDDDGRAVLLTSFDWRLESGNLVVVMETVMYPDATAWLEASVTAEKKDVIYYY